MRKSLLYVIVLILFLAGCSQLSSTNESSKHKNPKGSEQEDFNKEDIPEKVDANEILSLYQSLNDSLFTLGEEQNWSWENIEDVDYSLIKKVSSDFVTDDFAAKLIEPHYQYIYSGDAMEVPLFESEFANKARLSIKRLSDKEVQIETITFTSIYNHGAHFTITAKLVDGKWKLHNEERVSVTEKTLKLTAEEVNKYFTIEEEAITAQVLTNSNEITFDPGLNSLQYLVEQKKKDGNITYIMIDTDNGEWLEIDNETMVLQFSHLVESLNLPIKIPTKEREINDSETNSPESKDQAHNHTEVFYQIDSNNYDVATANIPHNSTIYMKVGDTITVRRNGGADSSVAYAELMISSGPIDWDQVGLLPKYTIIAKHPGSSKLSILPNKDWENEYIINIVVE